METSEANNEWVGDWPEGFEPRKLPEIDVAGVIFEVDVDLEELRRKDDIYDIKKFESMKLRDGRYTFWFDPKMYSDTSTAYLIQLPQMVELDPEGISSKYGVPVDWLPANDSNLKSNPDWVASRMQGALPIIKIVNQEYHIDLHMGELRKTNDIFGFIELSKLPVMWDGRMRFFYDFKKDEVVNLSPHITEAPKNVVMVEIPDLKRLDPVGYSYSIGFTSLLSSKDKPIRPVIRPYQSARIFSLERTVVAHQIRSNLKKMQSETTQQVTPIQPSQRTGISDRVMINKQKAQINQGGQQAKSKRSKGRKM